MILRLLTVALLLSGLATPAARALESSVVASPRAQASLVSEADSATPGQTLRVALRLRMADGWYTYWRNPGDAGAPPELDFILPHGVTAGPIAWPTPARHASGPVMSYGYAGEVVLPVALAVPAGLPPADPLVVQVHASWLVCERICVPEDGDFTLTLPVAGQPVTGQPVAAAPAEAALFAAADAASPRPAPWPAAVSPEGVLSLEIPGLDATRVRDAWFAPFAWGQIEHGAPQPLATTPHGVALSLHPGPQFRHAAGLSGIVVITDHTGRTSALALTAAPGPSVAAAAALPLWQLAGVALAGGLILNLMPCVFPVLAMKALGLVALAGHRRRTALGHAGAYAAGVVTTFLALAGLLVALRAAGAVAGWGFQFQSPVFVAVTAWLLLAIGLNMSGLYGIGGGAIAGIGAGAASRRGGAAGNFLTGLLAVLVATPCTAPFMGAAIAAALAAPLAVTLFGFLAMGIGFALPYVALAAIPGLARLLPRPGAWMGVLRQALAFPMYAAAVWLLWVVSLQAGSDGVLYTAGGATLIGFALWATGLAQHRAGAFRRLAAASAIVAGIAAFALLSTLAATPPAAAGTDAETFTPDRLAALRDEGRPVFLNMTAAWCVTCIVNEKVALGQPAIGRAFAEHGVTYLKGDWTRRDPAITAYLRAMGRDGVPLYVLYPPRGGTPVVLPQILTEQRVLTALARAGL